MSHIFLKKSASIRSGLARFLIFICLFSLLGCRSADQQLADFVVKMPQDFFQILPDSTTIFSGKLSVEKLLNPIKLVDFEQKKAVYLEKLAQLEAIPSEKLLPENQPIQLFFIEKLKKVAAVDADFSSFNPQPALTFFWQNKSKTIAERRADFELLIEKTPPFYDSAKLIFAQKKGKNADLARQKSIETWRFLTARRADFPKNDDLERAILAVKDWIGFCVSF